MDLRFCTLNDPLDEDIDTDTDDESGRNLSLY